MNYKIETTNNFIKELKPLAKKYRSLKTDLLALMKASDRVLYKAFLSVRDVIKSVYKFLQREKEKWRARVITCVKIVHQTIYLLSIFDKSISDNISDKRLSEILKIAELNK